MELFDLNQNFFIKNNLKIEHMAIIRYLINYSFDDYFIDSYHYKLINYEYILKNLLILEYDIKDIKKLLTDLVDCKILKTHTISEEEFGYYAFIPENYLKMFNFI